MLISFGLGLLGLFILNPLEFFSLDLKFVFAQRTYPAYAISDDILLILFDDRSGRELGLDMEGRSWREYLPRLIQILTEEKAAWITFDIEFSETAETADTPDKPKVDSVASPVSQQLLISSFEKAGNVIAGEIVENSVSEKLKQSLFALGNLNVILINGSPRKIKSFPTASDEPAFSLVVAGAYLRKEAMRGANAQNQDKPDALTLARATGLPLNRDIWVNFKYASQYFPVFSLVDVLESRNRRMANAEQTPLSIFKNKIVVIAKDLDRFVLPTTFGQKIFGGMYQALAIETIIQKTGLVQPVWFMSLLYLLAALALFYFLYYFSPAKLQWPACLLTYPVYWLIGYGLFLTFHLWLNFTGFLISSLVLVVLDRLYQKRLLVQNLQKLKQQFSQLENKTAKLLETGELKQDITDTLVHDIKNSVAAVEGMIGYLGEKYENDKQTLKNLNAAFSACTDITNLSSNLLDISRMETGQMQVEKKTCGFSDFEQMVDKFLALQLASHKQLQVEVIKPANYFFWDVDWYLFERVVHNLLNNAFKYTPVGGKIKISATETTPAMQTTQATMPTRTGVKAEFVFFNTGEPIAAAWQKLIFEKYGQVGEKRSKYSKGLGLYFCKQVMQLHEGDIRVESMPEGNAFIISFPVG